MTSRRATTHLEVFRLILTMLKIVLIVLNIEPVAGSPGRGSTEPNRITNSLLTSCNSLRPVISCDQTDQKPAGQAALRS